MKQLKKKQKQGQSAKDSAGRQAAAKSKAALHSPVGLQAKESPAQPRQDEFLKIFSEAKKKFKANPKTEMKFFSDTEQLKAMLPKGAPLLLKLESKFFRHYFDNPNDAYAIRAYRKKTLSSMLVFIGKNASEKAIKQLAEEIILAKKWERKPIKTVNKVEL